MERVLFSLTQAQAKALVALQHGKRIEAERRTRIETSLQRKKLLTSPDSWKVSPRLTPAGRLAAKLMELLFV